MRDATIGVLGAGAMGSGIAQVAASAGHRVVLADANVEMVTKARSTIGTSLDKLVAKNKLGAAARGDIIARIEFVESPIGGLKAFKDCAMVIEAVIEDLAVKKAMFAALSAVVSTDAVLASNTSSLSIASIASECAAPGRVIGVHFFNPAPVLPLVEIVPWTDTDAEVTRGTREAVESWAFTTKGSPISRPSTGR